MSCSNAKYGCMEKISYIGNRNHEEECIHATCYCPISGCDFVGSSKVLSNHFSHKHKDSQIKFCYDHSFIVSLKSNDDILVLQEESDDKIFIFNNSTTVLGNAINICCIGPNSSESEYSYDILAKSQICTLKLQSFAKNVRQFTLTTLSSDFLVIPFGSSEPRTIEICITPTIQIYIMHLTGKKTLLRVKSSDTVINVKKMILDKDDIELHQQRLIFDNKQLEDNLTLEYYNVQDKSAIELVLRLCGS
ncbi:E3 ubiquitin-protein ligase SINA [Trifolium repens]|nr:E3 ubiquitin-protein ligase SINA [Trifolium repens]